MSRKFIAYDVAKIGNYFGPVTQFGKHKQACKRQPLSNDIVGVIGRNSNKLNLSTLLIRDEKRGN
jgi:hypothetical protein